MKFIDFVTYYNGRFYIMQEGNWIPITPISIPIPVMIGKGYQKYQIFPRFMDSRLLSFFLKHLSPN